MYQFTHPSAAYKSFIFSKSSTDFLDFANLESGKFYFTRYFYLHCKLQRRTWNEETNGACASQWRGRDESKGDSVASAACNRGGNEKKGVWQKTLSNTPRINSLFSAFFSHDLQLWLDHFTQLPNPPCRWTFIYCTFFTESLSFPSPSRSRELQTLCFRHPFPLTLFLTKLPCILPSA